MITWWELFLMAMALGFAHFCRIQTTIQIKKQKITQYNLSSFLESSERHLET